MTERRKSLRMRSFLGGEVAFNKGQSKLECLIRNFSQRGAKLVFADPVTVPTEFDLYVPKKERSFRARVIWCRATEVGVTFVPAQPDAPIPLEIARRIVTLETETAALQERVTQLGLPD